MVALSTHCWIYCLRIHVRILPGPPPPPSPLVLGEFKCLAGFSNGGCYCVLREADRYHGTKPHLKLHREEKPCSFSQYCNIFATCPLLLRQRGEKKSFLWFISITAVYCWHTDQTRTRFNKVLFLKSHPRPPAYDCFSEVMFSLSLTRQVACFTSPWDVFHMSLWKTASRQCLERDVPLKIREGD